MSSELKLVIPKSIWKKLVNAAQAAAPIEACGLLAGKDLCVEKFYPMTNADASPEHFSLLPAEQFAAVKDMRKDSLVMLGIWHSHPASPPRLSQEDLRLAYTPDVVYVILSLALAEDAALRGYRVSNGVPEPVKIVIEDRQGL